LKFLVDVSAGSSLGRFLESAGHDVIYVVDRDPRMTDDKILAWAVEEHRIVLTLDKDFEEMVWRFGKKHRGIIRLPSLRRDKLLPLLKKVLNECSSDLAEEAIIIVDMLKIRVRKKQ